MHLLSNYTTATDDLLKSLPPAILSLAIFQASSVTPCEHNVVGSGFAASSLLEDPPLYIRGEHSP